MKKKICAIIMILMTMMVCANINNYVCAANHTTGEVISEADGFIGKGEDNASDIIDSKELKNLSDTIYNILLVIGIIAAVLIGAMLGIKFITAGVEGKAEVQKALLVYAVGCAIVFGAFTIWKIVVMVLQGLE